MKKKRRQCRAFDSPLAQALIGAAGIIMGILFIIGQLSNKPIERSEATFYSGEFVEYEVWNNYRTIHFMDGSTYDVYPHTETEEFREAMKSLKVGTVLHLAVNPNNDYVVEIKVGDTELMNFDSSQAEIDSYDDGYIAIGAVACAGGAFLILFAFGSSHYKKNERKKHEDRRKTRFEGQDDVALRLANQSAKQKILLEATVRNYHICYRRVKCVNELIVNGYVYDEKKGLFELSHRLSAQIDGHTVIAGYDSQSCLSYIHFDGKRIAEKKRYI